MRWSGKIQRAWQAAARTGSWLATAFAAGCRRFWQWRRSASCARLAPAALGGVLSALLLGLLFWWLGPWLVADPMRALSQQTPVRRYVDSQGRLVHLERTYDHQWRLPVPLAEMSKPVLQATLAAEDANFFSHAGVDYGAVLRAFQQNARHGRVISGASTITMQLAGMASPGRRRSWSRKIHQAFQARLLERRYPKERILAEYLNRVPFGGKLHGIEAASWYYFGKPAAQLNVAEAALLCGLPQKPNAFRPDRHWARARARQKLVLQMMERRGLLGSGEAERIYRDEPLPLRDFSLPSRLAQLAKCRDGMYYAQAKAEAAAANEVTCYLQPELDELLLRTLREQVRRLPGVRDGAAVLLDSGSGAVLAMIGTLDFASSQAGQVNAAVAVRSAGSTLKPFVYAEAIDGGILVEDSVLLDAFVRYGEYAPGNFDGRFHGRVSAGEALSLSLNTPAVRLLAALGPVRMAARFDSLHLWPKNSTAANPAAHQLAMTLGTAGHSLLDLTAAYAVLARGGDYLPARCAAGVPAPRVSVFTPGCCAMVSQMLRRRPLPMSSVDVAWKTGTSNGHRDAWCFAYTPEYTLGIWFGNKDGTAAAVLTGAGAAAPAAAVVMTALYRNRPLPAWPSTETMFKTEELCAKSGLTACSRCTTTRPGTVLCDVPLQTCRSCQNEKAAKVMIVSPAPGNYVADPATQTAALSLRAQPANVRWYVNNRYVGELPEAARMTFGPGRHLLQAVSTGNQVKSARVTFSVGMP